MTLADLIAQYPAFFYRQTWYQGHAFTRIEVERTATMPRVVRGAGRLPRDGESLPHTADLAALYVSNAADPVWRRYLWTCDHDDLGQRIFVGDNGSGLEIHRHLAITDRWGIPSWV